MSDFDQFIDEGLDPTSVWGAYAASLLQMMRQSTPHASHGMVIKSDSTPPVVGQPAGYPTNWYAANARCLLVHSDGQTFYHDGVTFSLIQATCVDNSVTTAKLQAHSVTPAKLSTAGGTPKYIYRVNLAGTDVEFVNPNLAVDALPVASLVGGSAGLKYLQSADGTPSWQALNSAAIINLFSDGGLFPIANIERGTAGQILRTNNTATGLEWVTAAGLLTDYSVALSKLAKDTTNGGKYLQYDPVTGILTPVPAPTVNPGYTRKTAELATLPAQGFVSNIGSHGLAGTPHTIAYSFVCTAVTQGYAIDDCIPLSAVKLDSGPGSADHGHAYTPVVNATNVSLIGCIGSGSAARLLADKGTGIVGTFDPTKWKFRYTAIYYS